MANAIDAPSIQLHLELRNAIVRSLATRRPLLHHLNADTSWLLQIPRPASAIKHGSRIYYNILIDPWFVGGQTDVAGWFSQQWHAVESKVKSVAEIEEMILRVESLAGGPVWGRDVDMRNRNGTGSWRTPKKGEWREEWVTVIDAVAVSHEFTDHCHKETLCEVHPDVPVFATEKAAHKIATWSHFRTVMPIPTFSDEDPDWRTHSLAPLPTWLSISRLTAPNDALYYHSALLIAFATHPFLPNTPHKKRSSLLSIRGYASPSPSPFKRSRFGSAGADDEAGTPYSPYSKGLAASSKANADAAECVVYTPHGILASALAPIAIADPPLHTLAFLHGLHDVSISPVSLGAAAKQQLNLGAKNGVLAQCILRAKYWVGTHDEVKKGGGFISWFLRRRIWTLEEALEEAKREAAEAGEMDEGDWKRVRFEEVGNGESRILE